MYYFLYGLFYLLSLLPFPIIYCIGDGIYLFVYYLSGYRKKVVLQNLSIAFPEKTTKERIRIAKDFYHGFIDTFVETIKMFSMSKKTFLKKVKGNYEIIDELAKNGKSVQIQSGHHYNWEYVNWYYAIHCNGSPPFFGIYMPLTNKTLDKIFITLRTKFATRLIIAGEFRNNREQLLKQQYLLGIIADQNPGSPKYAHWLNFFNRPTPFVTGPAKGARKYQTAVVFARIKKLKRGHYYLHHELIAENAADFTERELTLRYRSFLEQSIKEQPANYLWSHRRWKWKYNDEYSHLWIDNELVKKEQLP